MGRAGLPGGLFSCRNNIANERRVAARAKGREAGEEKRAGGGSATHGKAEAPAVREGGVQTVGTGAEKAPNDHSEGNMTPIKGGDDSAGVKGSVLRGVNRDQQAGSQQEDHQEGARGRTEGPGSRGRGAPNRGSGPGAGAVDHGTGRAEPGEEHARRRERRARVA